MLGHWQTASLKQHLGSFPDSSCEPVYLSAIAAGNAAKQIIPHTCHSQPQTFSHTLWYLQVTDHGASGSELTDRLSSVPMLEAAGHTLGSTIEGIEGQLKDNSCSGKPYAPITVSETSFVHTNRPPSHTLSSLLNAKLIPSNAGASFFPVHEKKMGHKAVKHGRTPVSTYK